MSEVGGSDVFAALVTAIRTGYHCAARLPTNLEGMQAFICGRPAGHPSAHRSVATPFSSSFAWTDESEGAVPSPWTPDTLKVLQQARTEPEKGTQ